MATTLDLRTQDGGTAGTVTLDDAVFGIEPNMAVLHQVVTAQLAAKRSGSARIHSRPTVHRRRNCSWAEAEELPQKSK